MPFGVPVVGRSVRGVFALPVPGVPVVGGTLAPGFTGPGFWDGWPVDGVAALSGVGVPGVWVGGASATAVEAVWTVARGGPSEDGAREASPAGTCGTEPACGGTAEPERSCCGAPSSARGVDSWRCGGASCPGRPASGPLWDWAAVLAGASPRTGPYDGDGRPSPLGDGLPDGSSLPRTGP
ncbi:hypothetical protein GCM10009663_69980 [Kitasatospora arboriphila]|uniref:Uncharacterized protein n=1 Tax=Kitasatospora arboriphila TaxID=258052 RepID=A0ABP4EPV2_9ACTN